MPKILIYSVLIVLINSIATANAADKIISNAHVYTVDKSHYGTQAVVVRGGEIVFVGDNDKAMTFVLPDTEVINAQGMMLMPGFIDTHNHVFEGASEAGGDCQLSPIKALKKQSLELLECQKKIGKPGDWVIGYGYQMDALWGSSKNLNVRKHLDQWFPANPVIIMEESSHSMIANSLALEKAGINANTDHPQGGTIMFARDGKPNGVLFDNAGDIIMELAWNSLDNNFQTSYEGLLAGMEEAVKYGITTIGDGRLYWQRGWYHVWQEASKNEEIITRVSLRPWIYPDVEQNLQLRFLRDIASGDKSNLLIVDQVKMYIDGVMHFGTAKVLKPYNWSWQENMPYGLNYIEPKLLPTLLQQLDEIGYGAHVHAVGDGGVRETLDAIEVARDKGSKQIYSMTHLEMVDRQDFNRFEQLDIYADFQVGAEFFADTDWATFFVGRNRARRMMPMREIYDTGAKVTFSSDWTVNSINPLTSIANSFRFRETKGLPDIESAIKAVTLDGAKALGLEAITGSIEIGKSADLILLDRSILDIDADEIEDALVVLTILQGKIVFDGRMQ